MSLRNNASGAGYYTCVQTHTAGFGRLRSVSRAKHVGVLVQTGAAERFGELGTNARKSNDDALLASLTQEREEQLQRHDAYSVHLARIQGHTPPALKRSEQVLSQLLEIRHDQIGRQLDGAGLGALGAHTSSNGQLLQRLRASARNMTPRSSSRGDLPRLRS